MFFITKNTVQEPTSHPLIPLLTPREGPDNRANIPVVVIEKSADCRGGFDGGQLGKRLALASQKEVHHDLERLAVLFPLKRR